MHTVNLVDALHDRMALVAQAMAERINPAGAWAGYRASEGLTGRFTKPPGNGYAPFVEYKRPGRPGAEISLGYLEMTDIQEIDKGPRSVIESGIEERHAFDVEFKHAIRYSETVEHQFERTTSFSEAAKRAWEVAAKASLSVEYAGIKGALEVSGKYGEEYARSSSESDAERDRISRLLEFTGPATFRLEAYRSRNREQRIVKARCDFDGKIYWMTGASFESGDLRVMEFTTFRTQFMPIAKRIADDSIYGYDEFMNRPLSDEEIDALDAPSGKIIEFPVVYDNVIVESLKEV